MSVNPQPCTWSPTQRHARCLPPDDLKVQPIKQTLAGIFPRFTARKRYFFFQSLSIAGSSQALRVVSFHSLEGTPA